MEAKESVWIFDIVDQMVLSLAFVLIYKFIGTDIARTVLLTWGIITALATLPYALADDDDFVKGKNWADFVMAVIVVAAAAVILKFRSIPIWAIVIVLMVMNLIRLCIYKRYGNGFWSCWIVAVMLDGVAIVLNFVL